MRLTRAFRQRLRRADGELQARARMLDSLSYRAVLARGFALVRGAEGALKHRAIAVKPGETLTLTFADGEKRAVATGKTEPRPRFGFRREKTQGDLF